MAVRHGYGKLTGTDALVFAYDTGDTVNSYKGEPTTNILPNANVNGNFTTSNAWGTYNTNQYNGNQYFSIGTIVDVTNNVVTTATSHPLRTYDAVNPQTTGGGLTGGTTYFIRKLSDTTFTIHAYNSSQNGSQGYINPNTGKHKVHDSIWLDQRVSVNITNFPTMWKGNPHLPNSGLVKEIIEGGGYEKGTNAMRLHLQRGDNVRDGMAYNVNTPVTVGDIVTVSFYYKAVNSKSVGKSLNWQSYFGSGQPNFSTTVYIGDEGETLRFTKTFTAPATFNFYQYWFPQASTDVYAIDISNLMVEINGHASRFTSGTRSATQGLLDLTGNTTIDLSNVSFDSNAQIDFDNTDDFIDLPNDLGYSTDKLSVFALFKSAGQPAGNYHIISGGQELEISVPWPGGALRTGVYTNGRYVSNHGSGLNDGNWHYIGFTYDGSTKISYIDGQAVGTQNVSGTLVTSFSNRKLGKFGSNSNYYVNGKIGLYQVHNKVLTAQEVQTNYRHYRKRFNLG